MESVLKQGPVSQARHPRELKKRYCKSGINSLLDHEVLELLLTYARPGQDVRPLADGLIERFGHFRRVLDEPLEDLASLPGMDKELAMVLKIAKDCSEYYLKQKVVRKHFVQCGMDLLKYLKMSMNGLENEQFRVVFLNTQSEIIEIETIHEGTIDRSVVYPRKVIERALYHKASALIFVHNHLGKEVRPSFSDKEITNMLTVAASSMDIEVYDHIIIGQHDYYSFRDYGLLNGGVSKLAVTG